VFDCPAACCRSITLPREDRPRTCCIRPIEPARFAGSLSFGAACCIADQVSRAFRSATRLCGCYGYRAGLDTLLRRYVLTRCSRFAHMLAICSVILFAHFFLRLRLPFVFRTGISQSVTRIADAPIPKHVHSVAVCRTSRNAPSFVC
jgi:hypothetical protein